MSGENWYEYQPESVLENEDYKILWISLYRQTMLLEVEDQVLVIVYKKKTSKGYSILLCIGDNRNKTNEIKRLRSSGGHGKLRLEL